MDAPDALPPVPEGMTIQITHDGVLWEVAAPVVAIPLAAFAWLGAVFVGGMLIGLAAVAVALVVGAVGAVLGAQHPLQTQIHVSDWAVSVTVRRLFGTERVRLPLDGIDVAKVSPPREEGGTGSLILRSGQTVLSVARGRSPDELRWMLAAIEQARHHHRQREVVEGKEYGFMKRAPEEVTRLTRPQPVPTPPSSDS